MGSLRENKTYIQNATILLSREYESMSTTGLRSSKEVLWMSVGVKGLVNFYSFYHIQLAKKRYTRL